MGIKKYAKEHVGSAFPALQVPDLPKKMMMQVDFNQEPESVTLHKMEGHYRRCSGDGCAQCAAGIRCRPRHVIVVEVSDDEGVITKKSLWMDDGEMRELAEFGPEDADAPVTMAVARGDNPRRSPLSDGTPWRSLLFFDGEK